MFKGLGIAALYKFVADGMKIFPSEVDYSLTSYKGAGIGMDVLPALLGVGYICGARVSSYLFAGGITGWFVLMPLICMFGGTTTFFPAKVPVSELGTWGLWSNYIKYIGAGAVAAGGIMSLIKSTPLILRTFRDAMRDYGKTAAGTSRLDKDLNFKLVGISIIVCAVLLWVIPSIPVSLLGAVIIVVFGFFFATVSSRMVGIVGSSNNPVSGMCIATLLIATATLKATGNIGTTGMVAAISIGTIVCIIAAIAGDTSQDLKTGYIVGATPYRQQIGEIIGVVFSAAAIGAILYLLNAAWGYGSPELPAPQASLMKMVVEGVMNGNLPWTLVFVGVAIAIVIEILGIPVLPFAVGLYLPIHLSTPMIVGGLIRYYFENRNSVGETETDKKEMTNRGILYASGLIAGEGLIGILLAVFAIIHVTDTKSLGDIINVSASFNIGQIGALVVFALLAMTIVQTMKGGHKKGND